MPKTTVDGLLFGGGAGLLMTQLTGIVAVGAYTLLVSFVAWGIIKAVMGLRVSPEEELEGLDLGEHGNSAYPDFAQASLGGHGVLPSGAVATSSAYAAELRLGEAR
jgi:Amt family ammonium transporter